MNLAEPSSMGASGAVRQPRWQMVLASVLAIGPLCMAVHFWPHDVGRYTNAAIAGWAEGIVVTSAMCLTWYRAIVTFRTMHRFEQAVLTMAIFFFPSAFLSDTDTSDSAGMPLVTLLLNDRLIFISALLIATISLFALRDRRQRLASKRNPD